MTDSNSSLSIPEILNIVDAVDTSFSNTNNSGIIPTNPNADANPSIDANTNSVTSSLNQTQINPQENLNVAKDAKTKIPFFNLQRMDFAQTEQQNKKIRNKVKKFTQLFKKSDKRKKQTKAEPVCEGIENSVFFSIKQRVSNIYQGFIEQRSRRPSQIRGNPDRSVSSLSVLPNNSGTLSRSSNVSSRDYSSGLEHFAGSSLVRSPSRESMHRVSTEAHRHTESMNVKDLKKYALNSDPQAITPFFQEILQELSSNDVQSFNKLIKTVTEYFIHIKEGRSDFGLDFIKKNSVQTLANVSQSTLSTEETPLLTEESVKTPTFSAQEILENEAAKKTIKKVRLKRTHSNSLFNTLKLDSRNPDQIFLFLSRAFENPSEKNGQILALFLQSSNSYVRNGEIKKFFSVNSRDSAETAEADDLLIKSLKDVKLGCVKFLKDRGETEKTRRLIEDFFQNILQFSAHRRNIEIDHFFLHALVEGLKFVSFAFDNNYLLNQATSVLTSKNTNQMKGFPGNRDLPKEKQYIKLFGLETYFFELFKYSMSDNSVGLSLQLDLQKYEYSGKGRLNKPFCTRVEKFANALVITEDDCPGLEKPITITPDKVDFTENEIKNKISDLMDSARCEAKDLCDRVTKTLNGKGDPYGIPKNMEYLFFYLRIKSGIIQYLFAHPTSLLLHVENFYEVEDKLEMFFQEINTFQFLLEKALNKNCDHIVEEEIKKPLKCTLRNVINFDVDDNQIVKKFKTLTAFINWLEDVSDKTKKLPLYDFENTPSDTLIEELLDYSSQFPITARSEKTLLGENYHISRNTKSDCLPKLKKKEIK